MKEGYLNILYRKKMVLKIKGIFYMLYGERFVCIYEYDQVDQIVFDKIGIG